METDKHSSNLATPTIKNRLRGHSKAVFTVSDNDITIIGSKSAVKTIRYFEKNIRMSDNPKAIPIHPSQPRFVDSETQPCILYYIWNIDTQSFARKRIYIPKNIAPNNVKSYVEKVINQKNAEIKSGYVTYNKKTSADDFIKEAQEEKRITKQEFTIEEAFNNFIARKSMSLAVSSVKAYKGYLKWFFKFCQSRDLLNLPLKEFTIEKANLFFDEIFINNSIKAKTHNEIVSFVKTVFTYYHKKKVITDNPCVYELKMVESEESHYPLTLDQISTLKNHILNIAKDEQLWLFLNFCFYSFARPRIELRLLKVKDILETTIFITSQNAKKNKNRHVIISEQLELLIEKYRLRTYPQDYYLFTTDGVPGKQPTGHNYFYKANRKALIACGITDKDYDLYSWKHTGNIQAKIAGTSIYELQKQNGHESIQQTEKYLRKIGAISPQDKWKLKQPTI